MSRIAEVKAKARRAVHSAFRLDATYQDASLDAAVPVTVRWHNRIVIQGDYDSSGYANIIDGIERIIFNREELDALGIDPRSGGVLVITEPGFDNAVLYLDAREPMVGPIEEKWWVKRSS
ncbi:hypothetical protein [Cronobacter phage JC01]|uniref:Uncharacterized protein n=1 Tax=Cronobacter phage JC01 TaxID=2729575 RepID=A0A6M3YQW3_9CAUD|nr:hypothetical protein JT331_gp18 [Cronobacter phage JC01]QJI52237.1 hypothetical protein [Cronobacter phage JC01]